MSVATIGARYQVVIPLKERMKIGLKPGQKIHVEVEENRIILEPVGTRKIKGILKDIGGTEDATEYICKLRREWENRS